MNLKEETLRIMDEHGFTPNDIDFISINNKTPRLVEIDEFWKVADAEYSNSFGDTEVNIYLVIVFKNGSWLERESYDGEEEWHYRICPSKPETYIESTNIYTNIFESEN